MKTIKLVLLFVLAISATSGFSQNVEFGLRGGANFDYSSIELVSSGGSFSDVAQSRTGYLFGAYTHFNAGWFGIQPEVYFSVQGADVTLGSVTGAVRSNFLQIPILFRMNFLKVFNFHVGPQYGLLLSSESNFGGIITDLKNQSRSGDFSFLAGLGLRLPLDLSVNLRYSKGFNEMIEEVGEDGLRSLKNSMLQLTVGYALVGR